MEQLQRVMTDITDQGLTETDVLALKASLVSFWCLGLLSPSPDPQNFPNVTKMGGATGIQTQTVLNVVFPGLSRGTQLTVCWLR